MPMKKEYLMRLAIIIKPSIKHGNNFEACLYNLKHLIIF
jgi:hypothetical protein